MTDVELRLTADLDQATKEVAGFRKEYADMVRAVEKPLRQVNLTRDLERDLEATGKAVRNTKEQLRALQSELINSERPSERLKTQYRDMASELQRLERVEARQQTQLSRMRGELNGAGIDTSRLAQEQRRLNAELTAGLAAGRNDAAVRGIRNRAAALNEQARAQRAANIETARNNLGVTQSRAARVELQALTQQFNLLRASGSLTTKELAIAQRELKRRIKETKDELRGLEGGLSGGLGGIAGSLRGGGGAAAGIAAAAVAGAGAIKAAQGADEVGRLDARLRLATQSQIEFNNAQRELDRIADVTQGDIAGLVDLYGRIQRPLREAGLGQTEALQTVEAVSLALKIGGASANEADGAVRQLSQALASGVLRGDEFNSVLEQSDRVAGALADELGVTVGQLRQMAQEGQLTTETVVRAFQNQLPKLREEYSKFAPEVGAAFDRLLKETQRYWGRQAKESGITDYLASTLNDLAKNTNRFEEIEKRSYDFREERLAAHAARMRDLQKGAADESRSLLEQQVKDTESALKRQVEAEKRAASELQSAKSEQLATQKRYQQALSDIQRGPAGDPSLMQYSALKIGAQSALDNGDIEGAKQQAQAALKVLQELAAAGESTVGFSFFVKELQTIERAADKIAVDDATKGLEQATAAAAQTRAALDELKNVKIAPTLDEDAQQELLNKLAGLAKKAGILFTIPVNFVLQDGGPSTSSLSAVPNEGYASGGYTGHGGRLEPAGVVHRGEVVWSQLDISRAGGVAVVEAMRRGMRGYASGGIVVPRGLPSIPSLAPALQQQLDGAGGATTKYVGDIHIGNGETVQASFSENDFQRLLRRERLKFAPTGRSR